MDKRQILILLRIGSLDVSQKCVESVEVDRNFSDIGDKFSITLIDAPATNILYDLELYMAAGYRNITLKYGDISENKLTAFNGTIWDYTNTFVGNIKKLTVTGIMSKYTKNTEGVANYTYNIDWNSYFNKRDKENEQYGAIDAILIRNRINSNYYELQKAAAAGNTFIADRLVRSSDILDPEFAATRSKNAQTLSLQGPGGSIDLPIPDCFYYTSSLPENLREWVLNIDSNEDAPVKYEKLYNFIKDPKGQYWGELVLKDDRVKPNASQISKYLSPYLASAIYVREYDDGKYTKVFTKWTNKSGWDSSLGKLTNITQNVLSSMWGCEFPSLVVGDKIKILAPYFIHHRVVNDFYNQNGAKGRWWKGSSFTQFYGKIPTVTYSGVEDVKFTKYHLDDENGGNDVWICVNSDNVVIAFIFERAGKEYGPFVAVDPEWNAFSKSGYSKDRDNFEFANDGRDPDKLTTFNIDIFSREWFAGIYRKEYFSKKMYVKDTSNNIYLYEKNDISKLRGFVFPSDPNDENATNYLYLQANPDKPNSLYGAAGLLNSGIGVDISYIVRQLAKLEGWKVRNNDYENTPDIVQTDLLLNSDVFIMQNQTAMDFIINNLVPRAITPIGKYTGTDGKPVIARTAQGGFYPFFDKDGYFHFQPLTQESITTLPFENLGYNLPNSPVLSFQINTKGTAFYTFNNIEYKPLNLVTGNLSMENATIDAISDAQAETIARTKGHNDTFDYWLGLTYDEVEKLRTANDTPDTLLAKMTNKAKTALVSKPSTLLMGSPVENSNEVTAKLAEAQKKIWDTVIKATMSMWGNVEVSPACNIKVTNMLKGANENGYQINNPQKHPSSGTYLILSMQDRIDSSGFIQNLNMLRYTDDVKASINKYKIDYSKKATFTDNIPRPDIDS